MRTRLALLLTCFCLHAGAEDVPKYLQLARQLVDEVAPEHNHYQHNGWIRVKGDSTLFGTVSASEVNTDCSGLVDALLRRTAAEQLDAFSFKSWKGYPKAENYYEEIHAGHGFQARRTIQEAEVGDILAAKFTTPADDTGHVMLIDAPPQRLDPPLKPLIPDTQQWAVTIIDASSAHWKGDTRYRENGGKQTGIGRGTVRVYTNAAGEPVGWAWSLGPGSRFRAHDLLAIGRPLLVNAPEAAPAGS